MPRDNRSKKVLSVVMIGCGDIAGGYDEKVAGDTVLSHAGAYRVHEGFQIAACVDPDDVRRKAFMSAWGVASGYKDLEECLSQGGEYDVASICAPTPAHEKILERLLETPVRAVFCEKPMTAMFDRTKRLVSEYEKAGKLICVNYMRRWDPEMSVVCKELATGQWGKVRSVTCFYSKGLKHTGSHMIDLLQFLLGPLSARRVLGERTDYTEDDPTIDAVLANEHGAPVYLIGGDSNDYARFEAILSCEKGVIEIFDSGFSVRRRRVISHRNYPGRAHLEEGDAINTDLDRAIAGAVENLYAAVMQGTPLASSGQTALAAERLCHELNAMPIEGEAR